MPPSSALRTIPLTQAVTIVVANQWTVLPKIFISYRRNDSATSAGRIYDRLEVHFGQGQVFMDVDTIRPGLDFLEVVQQAIAASDELIAVIGQEWLTASDGTGGRRLDQPDDLVRLEIATALERGIPVVPVLVEGAEMPRGTDLPEGLKELASRNALDVSDARFRSDVDRLIQALEATEQGFTEESVPQLSPQRKFWLLRVAGIAAVVAAVIVFAGLLLVQQSNSRAEAETQRQAALARELASQSQLADSPQLKVLLGIESLL